MHFRTGLMTAAGVACLMAVPGYAGGSSVPRTLTMAMLASSMCGKPAVDGAKKPLPLIGGLAPVHYPVSSANPDVQLYVDQGFALLYGFEYETAYDSFKKARELDPGCAICAWGEAMALGPNINRNEMSDKDREEALGLVTTALALPDLAARDAALLKALKVRYAPDVPDGQGDVHAEDYANTMIETSLRFPSDDIVMVLAAEAAMTVRPWDYWQEGGHVALPWGGKAMVLVETVLARNPDQPEAIHLYIHLTENSDNPKRAEAYADRLGALAPNSPHLVHMPSHTYYPLGRFADSIRINEQAIAVDERFARDLGESPVGFGYYFHHSRFILSAAQQVGDRATVLRVAAEMEKTVTPKQARESEWSESSLALALQARAQFETPADILAIRKPDSRLKILTLVWQAARAEAYARTGDVKAARKGLKAVAKARRAVSDDWAHYADRVGEMAQGRVELAAGNFAAAADHFRAAGRYEGQFEYAEPPLWDQPSGVALGRTLLMAGDVAGARAAFTQALKVRPGNAYAVWGRAQAEAKSGDAVASQASLAEFDRIWLGAKDAVSLTSL